MDIMLRKNAFPLILTLFFLFGFGYCCYTPLWNTPDEERHFAYCEYIAQHHKLPDYTKNPKENSVTMAFHPPLYYLMGSLFFWNDSGLLEELISINDEPGFNTVIPQQNNMDDLYVKKTLIAYMLRFFSLILSGLTLWCIYRTALIFFPGDILFASLCVLFVATIPEFTHISASVTNDSLAIAASSAYILSFLSFIKDPDKILRQVLSGIFLGLCLLSKTSTVIFLPVTICFVCIYYLRRKKNPTQPLVVIIGIAALIFGWWYLRNWLLFNDPMLSKTAFANNPIFMRRIPLSAEYWEMVFVRTFISYFGDFGALQFTISNFHLAVYGGIILLSIIGICIVIVRKRIFPYQIPILWFFSLLFLCEAGMLLYLNIKYSGFFMGRYIYIIIIPTTVAIFWGLQMLFSSRLRKLFFVLLAIFLVTMNLYSLFTVVKPAYAETFLQKAVDQSEFCCPSPKMSVDANISQIFICPYNNMCAVRIMVSLKNQPKDGELEFVLKEAGDSTGELYRIPLPLKNVKDFNRYCFFFPPIKDSMGKQFVFYFDAPSKGPNKDIALWYDINNSYHDGSMQINNKPFEGDLYFQVYCFTGLRPETDWQGRRAIAMDQGWYVTIRELQLYYEQSPDFRLKTETHVKLMHLRKAFDYRKKYANKNH